MTKFDKRAGRKYLKFECRKSGPIIDKLTSYESAGGEWDSGAEIGSRRVI